MQPRCQAEPMHICVSACFAVRAPNIPGLCDVRCLACASRFALGFAPVASHLLRLGTSQMLSCSCGWLVAVDLWLTAFGSVQALAQAIEATWLNLTAAATPSLERGMQF